MEGERSTQSVSDTQQPIDGGCCAVEQPLSESELRDDVTFLSATANDTRYEALRLIAASDDVCVCELAPSLGVSQSAVSHALSRLHTDGLVTRRKESQ